MVGTESCCLASLIEGAFKVLVQVALILPKVISRALTGVGVGFTEEAVWLQGSPSAAFERSHCSFAFDIQISWS